MSVDHDNMDDLVHAIRNTISENKKFLLNLECESDDYEVEQESLIKSKCQDDTDDFEEL